MKTTKVSKMASVRAIAKKIVLTLGGIFAILIAGWVAVDLIIAAFSYLCSVFHSLDNTVDNMSNDDWKIFLLVVIACMLNSMNGHLSDIAQSMKGKEEES